MKLTKNLLAASLLVFGLTGCVFDRSAIIKVNGENITKAQYQEIYNAEVKAAQNTQMGELLKDENGLMGLILRDRIVNELVLRTILEQEVKKHDIQVTQEEIQAKKDEITTKIGSKEKVAELLKRNSVSEKKFEEDIEKELKLAKLIETTGKTKVTEKEVKDFFNKNKAMFNFPERVRASHILIEVNPAGIKQEVISEDKDGKLTSEEINKKTQEIVDSKLNFAKEIRAKAVKDPSKFASLAKEYSDDKTSAERGGDLGFFTKESMVKPFSDVAFKIKPGTVSEIVTTDYGYHILIVTDKAKAGAQPYEKMKDEIREYLVQKKQVDALKTLLDGLKASAKIEYVDSSFDVDNIQKAIKEKSKEQEQINKQDTKKSK